MSEKPVDRVAWMQNLPEDLPIIHTFFSLLIGRSIKRAYCSIAIVVCTKGSSSASFIHATFMAVFKTHCDLCPCMFNTTTALLRHRESKHHIITESATSFPFYNGQELVQIPKQRGRRSSSYKQWLSGIVDSINSCLHPKAAGK